MFVRICPGCGARRKPPRWAVAMLAIVLGLMILIMAATVASVVGGPKKSANPLPPETKPVAAPSKPAKPDVATAPAVDTTLPRLLTEYKANEIAADAKYRDKVLRVTAIVGRVGKDLSDKPFVALHFGGKSDGFRASFNTDAGLAELQPWQEVVMRCRGGSSLGSPTLSDCVLERSSAGTGSSAQ